jgi:hypothetical protein
MSWTVRVCCRGRSARIALTRTLPSLCVSSTEPGCAVGVYWLAQHRPRALVELESDSALPLFHILLITLRRT